jgi:hypothetical protein
VLCSRQVFWLVSCTIAQSCWQYDNPASQSAGETFVLYVLVWLAPKSCWAQQVLVVLAVLVEVLLPLLLWVLQTWGRLLPLLVRVLLRLEAAPLVSWVACGV